MERKQKLKLAEWDRGALLGIFPEPSSVNAIHPNGILCPLVLGKKGEVCNGDLWDLPLEVQRHKGPSKRAVECEKCGWWGSREISTKGIQIAMKEKISFSKWNEVRALHHELLVKKYDDKVVIVCDHCGSNLEDQHHRDTSKFPWKVQVICSNEKCGFNGYRLE